MYFILLVKRIFYDFVNFLPVCLVSVTCSCETPKGWKPFHYWNGVDVREGTDDLLTKTTFIFDSKIFVIKYRVVNSSQQQFVSGAHRTSAEVNEWGPQEW